VAASATHWLSIRAGVCGGLAATRTFILRMPLPKTLSKITVLHPCTTRCVRTCLNDTSPLRTIEIPRRHVSGTQLPHIASHNLVLIHIVPLEAGCQLCSLQTRLQLCSKRTRA